MVFGPLEWENLQYELGFPALKLGISEMWSPVSMGLKTLGCISSYPQMSLSMNMIP